MGAFIGNVLRDFGEEIERGEYLQSACTCSIPASCIRAGNQAGSG